MSDSPTESLAEYRSQADQLEAAFKKVQSLREETANLAAAAAAALSQRERLLAEWTDSEDEKAVTELSKLGARADVYSHKIATQNGRLSTAEEALKTALAQLGTSFNTLFLTLRGFVIDGACERIAAMLHPKVRTISKLAISEVAGLTTEVVDLQPLQINLELGAADFENMLPAKNVYFGAERALPKVEALLAEAAKQVEKGFVPPVPFTPRARIGPPCQKLDRWRQNVELSRRPLAAA